jgi:hypothetical protein
MVQILNVVVVKDCLLIEKTLDHSALEKMLGDDLLNVVRGDSGIERALRVYDHDGAELAETEAACPNDLYFLVKTLFGKLIVKCCEYFRGMGGGTACTAAHKHMCSYYIHLSILLI